MAKARKQKGDGSGTGGGATVLHQKLCLSIDMENQLIYGYTEIKALLAENDTFALHADNMTIRSILVDGETVEFDYSPHWKNETDQPNWSSISCLNTVADAACSTYTSSLNREATPNLIVSSERSIKSMIEQQLDENSEKYEENSGRLEKHGGKTIQTSYDQIVNGCNGSAVEEGIENSAVEEGKKKEKEKEKEEKNGNEKSKENGNETENEKVKNIKLVHIDYILEKAETGIHFVGNVMHSSNQIRRAHCWFPCVDTATQRCPFDLEFTVSTDFIAVSNGDLLYQVFLFHILLVLHHAGLKNDINVSHICLSPALSKLQNTIAFFHDAYSCYEDYLAAPFPLGLYKQIFLPSEMTVLPASLGASMCIFSSDILHDEKVIDLANHTVCESDVSGATALSSTAASSDLYGTQTIGSYGKVRSLKAFRHLANKVGNLERPFLKEFFPRWIESCGCPVMRLGISYSKKRNMVELAVSRGCTGKATPDPDSHTNGDTREGDAPGWPGMMSVRVHETDGAYDHPVLPMAGEALQVVEIQCHSKLAAKRVWKSKKNTKLDGSDDNIDTSNQENRTSMDSPLLWIRVDPEMEYLAEIHFHQPVQMWINQLEKDKDVISQSQAISALEKLPQLSFAVINALNNFLNDTKAFWRVRIEAAYALAVTSSEATDLAGLLHLVKFYKSRRFDSDIGMPRPNDFHDVPEYFVLEYNDNNGNVYSDVYWLSAMVLAIGELEFGQQDPIRELIAPFRDMDKPWKVRIEASMVLIDLELHHKGLDAALLLFLKYVDEEKSLRGATKLAVHILRICQANIVPSANDQINLTTLIGLLHLLAGTKAYNNVFLRHHVFCILQVAAGRSPTLFGVPKVVTPPLVVKDICSDQHTKADSSIPQPSKPQEPSTSTPSVREVLPTSGPTKDADNISNCSERRNVVKIRVKLTASSSKASDADHRGHFHGGRNENEPGPCSSMSVDAPMVGTANEPLNVSNHNIEEQNSCHDRESRMSASVSTVKLLDRHDISRELQCTADSRLDALPKNQFSPAINLPEALDKPGSQLEGVSTSYEGNQAPESVNGVETKERKKKDKKDKKRKRDEKRLKKDDPEYLEKKRLKKEKKMEKELARKQLEGEGRATPEQPKTVKPSGSLEVLPARPPAPVLSAEPAAVRSSEPQVSSKETTVDTARTAAKPRIKIKVKPLVRKPEGN
ncbi:Transcription initiation factor TFIID subunit 2 [Zea mays]|uniref:Transcription initiation factor TFIID subunit 2 n=1 Tax=Zea mays TaxID=4577 RepID=A0A1D6I459_MAIZE|nr:Transcription initiation factor TFIID subunit 2 [Zea mays]